VSVPVVPVRCSRKSSIRDRATMLATITRVLETASRPLRAREVHAAAEQLAGESLRWTSAKQRRPQAKESNPRSHFVTLLRKKGIKG